MNKAAIEGRIALNEGSRLKPYYDTLGFLSIGRGRNLQQNGISQDEEDYLFNNDINRTLNDANSFSWFASLTDNRQIVIADMIFNLGLPKFLLFKKLINAIESRDWNDAADQIENSDYFRQVGMRAIWNRNTMRSG